MKAYGSNTNQKSLCQVSSRALFGRRHFFSIGHTLFARKQLTGDTFSYVNTYIQSNYPS